MSDLDPVIDKKIVRRLATKLIEALSGETFNQYEFNDAMQRVYTCVCVEVFGAESDNDEIQESEALH